MINVLSYNIHKGFNVRRSVYVLPEIKEALLSVNPDIVFLQEVQGQQRKRPLKKIETTELPQTDFLASNDWPFHVYGKNAVYGQAHHGNALLSKHPFILWENIDISLAKRASRSLLHGVIELPDKKSVHIICIHLGLFKAERKIQLTVLSERIKGRIPEDAPLIIAGDFNDWRHGLVENHLEIELQLKEVYKTRHGEHAKTFPSWRPAFKVDRIYYRGLKLHQVHVLSGEPWRKLSDHLPLYAEFELEG